MKKIVLVDGNSLVFKAYYATAHTGNLLKAPCGTATNAVRTTANMINKLLRDRQPSNMLVAFDAGKKTFRHDKLESYKDGRSKTPDELREQFPLVKEYLNNLGIKHFDIVNYEADDIIATVAKDAAAKDYQVEVFSSDNDLLQLVSPNVTVFLTNKGVTNLEEVNSENFFEKYGHTPEQVKDMKGLVGDKSDNLTGVPGVGTKTALKLIAEYGTLEKVLENIETQKGKLKERLEENKELALLCKEIATLYYEVDIPLSLEEMDATSEMNTSGMTRFLQRYALNSILNQLNLSKTEKIDFSFRIVKNIPADFDTSKTSLNIEVIEDNYNMSKIHGISISNGIDNLYVDQQDIVSPTVKEYLESQDSKLVFGNAKTINALRRYGIELSGVTFDTQLAAYLIDHKITADIVRLENFFSNTRTIQTDGDVYGKGVKKFIPETKLIAEHSITKSIWLHKSEPIFRSLIESEDLTSLYFDVELPLSFILANAEKNGVLIDLEEIKSLEEKVKTKLAVIESQIYLIADEEFNVSSPSQLGIILFEKLGLKGTKTKTGQYSTANEKLVNLINKHEIIKYIILFRKYSKLLSTYIIGTQNYIQEDNRVRTIYNQTLTQTGRLSSKYPNLQNISIKDNLQKEFRKVFIAPEGKTLASFDYSQIELRILAHVAKCSDLITAFQNNADIHTETAAKVFNLLPDQVTDKQRSQAKAVNFGIIYGISDFGLARQLKISMPKAKEIINAYKKSYPEIEQFRLGCIEEAKSKGFVTTMFNRKRFIPELNSSSHITREFGKRAATNAPIQGAASDIIKIAMIEIEKKLKEYNFDAKLIMQIHDELIFEINDSDINSTSKMIVNEMTSVCEMLVPLEVNHGIGKNLFKIK